MALVFVGCSDDTPNEQEVKDEYAALTRAGKTALSSRGEESRSTNEKYKLIEYPTIQGTSDGELHCNTLRDNANEVPEVLKQGFEYNL